MSRPKECVNLNEGCGFTFTRTRTHIYADIERYEKNFLGLARIEDISVLYFQFVISPEIFSLADFPPRDKSRGINNVYLIYL